MLKDAPPLPHFARHLWAIYEKLDKRRKYTESGPVAITDGDLADYERRTRERLDRWEAEAILGVDDEYLAASLKAREKGP